MTIMNKINDCNDNKDVCLCKRESGWIPINSIISFARDNQLSIRPPSGWVYVGTDERSGGILEIRTGETKVSCTCNTSGNCSPFVGTGPKGSASGCSGSCTNCTMKQSGLVRQVEHIFSSGGYVNLSDNIKFIDFDTILPAAFSEILIQK